MAKQIQCCLLYGNSYGKEEGWQGWPFNINPLRGGEQGEGGTDGAVRWRDDALSIRVMSTLFDEWEALRTAIVGSDLARKVPILEYVLLQSLPVFVPREELLLLKEDFEGYDRQIDEELTGPAKEGFFALSVFVAQAAEQREAGISFEVWDGELFEEQNLLGPGVDLLRELEKARWPEAPEQPFEPEGLTIWRSFVVIVGETRYSGCFSVRLIPLSGGRTRTLTLGQVEYKRLYQTDDCLLVACSAELFGITADGTVRWSIVGGEEVVVDGIKDGVVYVTARGEMYHHLMNGPSTWDPLRVRLDSGEIIAPLAETFGFPAFRFDVDAAEQIECSLLRPNEDLLYDKAPLMSISSAEWEALRSTMFGDTDLARTLRKLRDLLHSLLPTFLPPKEALMLWEELSGCGRRIDPSTFSGAAGSGFSALSRFAEQAANRREACLFEVQPARQFHEPRESRGPTGRDEGPGRYNGRPYR